MAGLGAGGAKATLIVTMGLTDLQRRVGAARTLGGLDHGSLLGPETARRITCDARVIPILLGSSSEVLDHARPERLCTPAQAGGTPCVIDILLPRVPQLVGTRRV